ncbi:MAG: S8 family peptidase [Chloroflexota bacterium]
MIRRQSMSQARARRAKHPTFVPGLLVVRIKEDVVANVPEVRRVTAAAARALRLPEAIEKPLESLQSRNLIREVVPIFAKSLSLQPSAAHRSAMSFTRSVRESENEDLRGINLLRLSAKANLPKIEKQLSGVRGIEYVHRVPARWLAHAQASAADPLVNRQWGLRAIRWFDALPLPDASNVKVAVLDTGIDATHPDLAGRFADYNHDGSSAKDIIGHGTHVAGIIAANPNNHIGIAGISTPALHIWKIFGDQPASDGEDYVDEVFYQRALNAARNAGVRVVNLSIGGGARSQTEELLFRRLMQSGAVIVAAMGNEFAEGNPIEYPGAYPGVVAVGAIDEANRRAPFSNTGRHIDLSAPGVNILSTLPMKTSRARKKVDTKYNAWDGTSMATPHVTAAAALIIARHPDWTPVQVADHLRATATKVPEMGGKDRTREHGTGLLNLKDGLSS